MVVVLGAGALAIGTIAATAAPATTPTPAVQVDDIGTAACATIGRQAGDWTNNRASCIRVS